MKDFNFIDQSTPDVIDDLYQKYLKSPESVDASWRAFFKGFEFYQLPEKLPPKNFDLTKTASSDVGSPLEAKVEKLANAYRRYGHLFAKINPLNVEEIRGDRNLLTLARYSIAEADLNKTVGDTTVKALVEKLEKAYCSSVGAEIFHITNENEYNWWKQKLEDTERKFSIEEKKSIYEDLVKAEIFENFLHMKFVGQKRFSLEGGIAMMPGLEMAIDKAALMGAEDFVIAMAHRGRLNVLVNTMKKEYEAMFQEFEGGTFADGDYGSGDVKYHMGYSCDRVASNGKKIHLSMAFNPSHLEIVNPVAQGMARAKVKMYHEGKSEKVATILMHGDAAFAGQGVTQEVLQMSRLPAYSVGGIIHIVTNNQIGFTTDFRDSRSTMYTTDVAKMLEAPILHVNGDDVEAVVRVCELAAEYRQTFQKDVFVDLICYRRYGHNEGDEPRFTQPKMYAAIDKHLNPMSKYAAQLESENVAGKEELTLVQNQFRNELNEKLDSSRKTRATMHISSLQRSWEKMKRASGKEIFTPVNTKAKREHVEKVAKTITTVPNGFSAVPKSLKLLKDREEMVFSGKDIDWGTAELLAYGALLLEKFPVRMTGQDVRRGTFTHRHAIVVDTNTNEKRVLLNEMTEEQAKMDICDSLLSEEAVMGFEYGYSTTQPEGLTIWEAQFGDFANGAQVIVDQFISSAESKWHRHSGITLLLPHGLEGQGPEHSSARPERFLQLCAEENMFVCNLTNSSQIFHALRRQVHAPFRKPLVVMTPKSLLRHPKAICKVADLTEGKFFEIIDDPRKPKSVKNVILCTGKIYYELEEKRAELLKGDVAIVRIEQLYPLHKDELKIILQNYGVTEVRWVQDEPENQGYWWYMQEELKKMGIISKVVARASASAPATGFHKRHVVEQQELLQRAFEGI